jgi:hypothetical protein
MLGGRFWRRDVPEWGYVQKLGEKLEKALISAKKYQTYH